MNQARSAPTSRLVVFRLPEDLTNAELKDHFASLGLHVTDAKVLHRRDGQSRQMGFVGFSDVASAVQAKEYYHGTWLKKGRIEVDFAQHVAKAAKRPLQKITAARQAPPKTAAEVDKTSEAVVERDDPDLEDDDAQYLAKRRKVNVAPQPTDDNKSAAEVDTSPAAPECQLSIDRIFVRNLPFTATQDDISAEFSTYGDVSEVRFVPQSS